MKVRVEYLYTDEMIGVLDCNNFFVSCERLFRPDLEKRPVAVLSSNDGCVVARSQEIKDLGIPMGVPYFQVKSVCTQANAVLFSSNFALYRDVSSRVMSTLRAEVGSCEVYSVDEAFFTVNDQATIDELLALRTRITTLTGIPVSIGVGSTKTIAKQASKMAKKGNGVTVLDDAAWQALRESVQCAEIWGIGRQLSARLRSLGIETAAHYVAMRRSEVRKQFGVAGERILDELSGISVHLVGDGASEPHQSITSSRSFAETVTQCLMLESAVSYHVEHAARKLREEALLATRMSVYIRPSRYGEYAGARGHKEVEFSYPTAATRVLTHAAVLAVRELFSASVPYKKAGVVLTGLLPERYVPASLFATDEVDREAELDRVTDSLNERFGAATVHLASTFASGSLTRAKLRSPAYTTRWDDIPKVTA